MARRATGRFRVIPLTVMVAFAIVVAAVFAVTHVGAAQAAPGQDSTTAIGVSANASEATLPADAASKFATGSPTSNASLSQASARTGYEVKTIGPEQVGEQTAGIALEGDTVVVTRDEGWQQGSASAYTLACNDGYDATASGVLLTESSMTVAVPASRTDLLGRTVEIYYNGLIVTATVTDTGGFAPLGRDLDLAGGVWRALGASSTEEWGVRTVSYRFL